MEAEVISMDSGSCGASASSGYGTQKTSQMPHHREEKKERVKQCIRELNALMPEGSQRKGLLGTLQQVVQRMKQIKAEAGESAADKDPNDSSVGPGSPTTEVSAPFPPPAPPVVQPTRATETLQGYRVVMSLGDSIICEVSESLVELLGYPKDYWLRQSILDFLRKHDLVTFTSKLSQCRALIPTSGRKEEKEELVEPFSFKLRHYKSLRTGFNLVRPDYFTAFYGSLSVQTLRLPKMVTEGEEGETKVTEASVSEDYLVLECKPITSAFTEPGMLPTQRTFTTKHTVFCNYCHVDQAAIPLLGYLPQDMINTSIFNYYHPLDLPLLFTVYQQVVSNPGESYSSIPYRMRAQNGDYLLMETKWSCNVNPWTKQWDTIVGHHTVIKGPDNPNVFDNGSSLKMAELPAESPDICAMEKLIKKLLLQPIQETEVTNPGPVAEDRPIQEPLPSSTQDVVQGSAGKMKPGSSSESGLMSTDSFLEEAIKRQENNQDEESSTGSISLSEDDLSVLYEGLSYASNIRRYLMSHGSSADNPEGIQFSHLGSGDGEGSSCTQEALTVDVELPLPARIPSQASSTKALVSEHEREELAPPSPAHEDLGEEAHKDSTSVEPQDYTPIRLSTDALKVHDKIHEKFFIEKMMKEKAGYLLSQAGSRLLKTLGRTNQKRHQQDLEQDEKIVSTKLMRQDDGKAIPSRITSTSLHPPFPITSLDTRWTHSEATSTMAYRLSSPGLASTNCFHPSQLWQPPAFPPGPQAVHPPPPHSGMFTFPNMTLPSPMFSPMPVNAVMTSISMGQPQHPHSNSHGTAYTASTQSMPRYWPVYAQHSIPVYSPVMATGQPNPNMCSSGFPIMMGKMALQPAMVRLPISSTTVDSSTQDSFSQNVSPTPLRGAVSTKEASKSHQGPGPPLESVASAMDMDFSTDCTDSSLLYLLETSTDPSQNQSCEEEDRAGAAEAPAVLKRPELPMAKKPTLLPKDMEPPWKMMVNWNEHMQMRYEVPMHNCGELLKQDCLSLKRMKQPHQLTHQLDELLSYLSPDKDSESQDDDVLLMSECAIADQDESDSSDSSHVSPTKSAPAPEPVAMEMAQPKDEEEMLTEQDVVAEKKEEVEPDKDAQKSIEMAEAEDQTSRSDSDVSSDSLGSPDRPKSTDKLSENDVSDGSESGSSKTYSDLTPSESRSHEEAGSSMKESDNASSSGSIGKDNASNPSSESENDSKNRAVKSKVSAHKKQDYFSKLFVPMRVWYEDSSKQASWLREVDFGEHMQMLYQQGHRRQEDILMDDKQILTAIGQPELVRMQMSCLLQELQGSEGECPSSSSLSSRDEAETDHAPNTARSATSMAPPPQAPSVPPQVPSISEADSQLGYEGEILTDSSIQSYQRQHMEPFSHAGPSATSSGFSSMSNADSGRGNSSSGNDKMRGGSSSAGTSDKTGSGSSKESSGSHECSVDHSRSSSNSDPDSSEKTLAKTSSARSKDEMRTLSPVGLAQVAAKSDPGGDGAQAEAADSLPSALRQHSSGPLPASVIEKLDSVMSVFSLKEAMQDSRHLELLQE